MATLRRIPPSAPLWNGRVMEWSLLLAVIVVVSVLFVRQTRVVQGQAELAAVTSTLAALRTALVIEHLQTRTHGVHGTAHGASKNSNPFEMLERRPANYVGEIKRDQMAQAPAGSWAFDPVCVCIGYRPLNEQWFDSPSGEAAAWFQLSGAPGPLQLTPQEAYVWQSHPMN